MGSHKKIPFQFNGKTIELGNMSKRIFEAGKEVTATGPVKSKSFFIKLVADKLGIQPRKVRSNMRWLELELKEQGETTDFYTSKKKQKDPSLLVQTFKEYIPYIIRRPYKFSELPSAASKMIVSQKRAEALKKAGFIVEGNVLIIKEHDKRVLKNALKQDPDPEIQAIGRVLKYKKGGHESYPVKIKNEKIFLGSECIKIFNYGNILLRKKKYDGYTELLGDITKMMGGHSRKSA